MASNCPYLDPALLIGSMLQVLQDV